MKKIAKIFTLLATIILINSCSTEGNSDPSIYHKWYYKEVIYMGDSQIINSNACSGTYIEFYDFNKVKIVGISNCHENLLAEGTFLKEENNITTNTTVHSTNEHVTQTYEILELTKYNLTMNEDMMYYPDNTGMLVPANISKLSR